ncbi:MAG: efflux transporter outer membrane subunit [Pseudomonadota bacterium]
MRIRLSLFFALGLAGCISSPRYEAPDLVAAVEGSERFLQAQAEASRDRDSAVRWWLSIGGQELDRLVVDLLATSPDLEAARARVGQSRALSRQAFAGRLPVINGSADSGQLKLIEPVDEPFAETSTLSVTGSWELDIFGKLRAADRAARLRADAAILGQADLERSLIAETARLYVGAWALRERLRIAEALATSFEETANLTGQRYRTGSRTLGALDVQIARQNAFSSASDVPAIAAQYQTQLQAIDVLLGRLPGTTVLRFEPAPNLRTLSDVSVGAPADLLLERPDVALAEAEFRAGLADLGVARAELLPSFSLTAALTETTSPANFLGSETLIATYAGEVVAPIFDGGRRRAEVRRARAATDELAASFASAAVTALNDMETALIQERATTEELELRRSSLEAARLSDQIASERYVAGQVSLITLLETRRSLNTARQSEVTATESRLNARISLYEALGGDWFPPKPDGKGRTDS